MKGSMRRPIRFHALLAMLGFGTGNNQYSISKSTEKRAVKVKETGYQPTTDNRSLNPGNNQRKRRKINRQMNGRYS